YILLGGRGASSLLVVLMAVRALVWLKQRTVDVPRLTVLAFGLAQLAFVSTACGDWMIGGRFFVAMVPFATLAAVDLLWTQRRWLILAVAALQVYGLVTLTRSVDATLFSFPKPDPPYLMGRS